MEVNKRKDNLVKLLLNKDFDIKDEDELVESFKTMVALKKEVKTPVSYHANGKAGSLSRIINPILGGQIIFCVDRFSQSSTMEQLDLKTVKALVDNLKKIMWGAVC